MDTRDEMGSQFANEQGGGHGGPNLYVSMKLSITKQRQLRSCAWREGEGAQKESSHWSLTSAVHYASSSLSLVLSPSQLIFLLPSPTMSNRLCSKHVRWTSRFVRNCKPCFLFILLRFITNRSGLMNSAAAAVAKMNCETNRDCGHCRVLLSTTRTHTHNRTSLEVSTSTLMIISVPSFIPPLHDRKCHKRNQSNGHTHSLPLAQANCANHLDVISAPSIHFLGMRAADAAARRLQFKLIVAD